MKEIFKIQLFNHGILVCENKETVVVSFAARYLLYKAFNIRITNGKNLVTRDMVEFSAKRLGKTVPEPFYKGFPDSVKALSPDELQFDQLMHYLRTYGMGDFSEPGHSLLEERIERTAFREENAAKDFIALPESEAVDKLISYAEALLSGTRPLSDEHFDFVCEFIREYNYSVRNCSSKNLAIRLLLALRDEKYTAFISMSDVIKLVDELNYRDYEGKNVKNLNLKNQDRKFITKIINRLFHSDSCDIRTCYEKKADWCGLLHHIHYKPFDDISAQFVQSMRGTENASVYSEFEQALAKKDIRAAVHALKTGKGSGAVLRNLNYIISRCETAEDTEFVISQMATSNNIVLLQLLMTYSSKNKLAAPRTFKFTRHNKIVVHAENEEEVARRKSVINEKTATLLCNTIKANLQANYRGKLGKVYIDPIMKNIALPLQENAGSSGYGVLPKGSRIHMEKGKKLRAFTYWEKVDDIDLSVIGIRKDGSQAEFSWRTMADAQSEAIIYSGDQTSGFDGGSEYFDIELENFKKKYPDTTHLIFCNNVFSNQTFNQCICRAGYMFRDLQCSGKVFDPKAVKSSFTIDANSTFAYLFAIDLQRNDFIWLNMTRESRAHIAGETPLAFLTHYFNVTDIMNFYEFFSMLASEVTDDISQADIIVSDFNVNAAECVEVIRSCDFERMISLMNA